MGAGSSPVEDIMATDPPPYGNNGNLSGSPITPVEVSPPARRQSGTRRSVKRRKNGNWMDEQLSSAMDAFDSGMNMKKASEQFHIPYTSFREHVYGNRKSRQRGTKGILTD